MGKRVNVNAQLSHYLRNETSISFREEIIGTILKQKQPT